jgi:hypothetical protein
MRRMAMGKRKRDRQPASWVATTPRKFLRYDRFCGRQQPVAIRSSGVQLFGRSTNCQGAKHAVAAKSAAEPMAQSEAMGRTDISILSTVLFERKPLQVPFVEMQGHAAE